MYITGYFLLKKEGKVILPQYLFDFSGNFAAHYPEEPEFVLRSLYSKTNYLAIITSIYKAIKKAVNEEPTIKKYETEIMRNEIHIWMEEYPNKNEEILLQEVSKVIDSLNGIYNFKGEHFTKEYDNGTWATFRCSPNFLKSPEMALVKLFTLNKALTLFEEEEEIYLNENEENEKERILEFLIRNSKFEEIKTIKKIENVLYSNRGNRGCEKNFILNWI